MANKDVGLYDELTNEIQDSKNNTITWAEAQDKYYRLRVRYKKNKNFPFPGCSNLRLPTIEMYIRKLKAALVAIYANVKPRCQIVPQTDVDLDKANRIERYMDWVMDVKMGLLSKLIIVCDLMLEKGFSLFKVVWKMEDNTYVETLSLNDLSMEEAMWIYNVNTTDDMLAQALVKKLNVDMSETVMEDNIQAIEKAVKEIRKAKDNIKVELKDEVYNAPYVIPVDPAHCFVPSDAGIEVQDLRWICHEYFEPYETLQMRARNGELEKDAVEDIDIQASIGVNYDRTVDGTKDLREGIDRKNNPSHLVKIWELYKYHDLDKDDIPEKCIFILAPEFKLVLKKGRLPFDHQKFPFVRFSTEIIDDRWFSTRGIPEHLEDLSKEIDAQHNQKIDNQTIRNAPMFAFRSGIVNPKLVRFIPGQGIPVPGMTPLNDAITILNNTNQSAEFSYEREEMILKGVIQEYIGIIDYSLQSMMNRRQPRTASEVNAQQQAAGQVQSLDTMLFTMSLTELFTQILELSQQYMPERVFALVTGDNGVEPLHLTRDEIQGKYHVVVRGNDMNSNPMLRAQKSLARVQMLLSPIPLQMGIVNPMNAYNVLKRYLQDDGELAWKELISPPQPPQPPQPPPAATFIKPQFNEMTDGEQAQVLKQIGIQPDIKGRALKSQAKTHEKAFDMAQHEHQREMDKAKFVMEVANAEKDRKLAEKKADAATTPGG